MQVEWYGQSAFRLGTPEQTVFIDPFGDLSPMVERGMQFDYPAIEGVSADLVLVTHEHMDHNGVEVIGGDPVVIRSTAGTFQSPVGEIVALASEHDEAAGTERGPNTIFLFVLDGIRVCHFGDFGQRALREEQAWALGEVDMLILPVGGGPTIGASQAKEIVDTLQPTWVLPMHYRTARVSFLETVDAFLELSSEVQRLPGPAFQTGELSTNGSPVTLVPAAP